MTLYNQKSVHLPLCSQSPNLVGYLPRYLKPNYLNWLFNSFGYSYSLTTSFESEFYSSFMKYFYRSDSFTSFKNPIGSRYFFTYYSVNFFSKLSVIVGLIFSDFNYFYSSPKGFYLSTDFCSTYISSLFEENSRSNWGVDLRTLCLRELRIIILFNLIISLKATIPFYEIAIFISPFITPSVYKTISSGQLLSFLTSSDLDSI